MNRHDRAELLARLDGRRVIASVSGGKDSAAMSLYLKELEIDHDRVFLDTQWEHESTYDYLRGELTRVLGTITEIRNGLGMVDLLKKKQAFPWGRARWCTQELKVFPMQRHLKWLMDAGVDPVNAVGIRRGESKAREAALEWEWSAGFDAETWRPLVEWSEQDVIDIHRRHGLKPNPIYMQGGTRVGCWPCVMADKASIRLVADTDPARIDEIRAVEQHLTEKAGAPRTFFKPGTIDEVVNWSRTSFGGKQFAMFAEEAGRDSGCMRWGFCEPATKSEGGDE